MTRIADVMAWESLDSRGHPTVTCQVQLADGRQGQASAPAGASAGTHEAQELRDGGSRYGGFGVLDAVRNIVYELGPAVVGQDPIDQESLDEKLALVDGTDDFSRVGANATLAVSIAAALSLEEPVWARSLQSHPRLPLPMINILSGGAHSGRTIDIQDVLAIPVGATTFSQAIEWASAVRRSCAELATERHLEGRLIADEGGIAPRLSSNREALDLVVEGIERSELIPGSEVSIGLDVAASQFFQNDLYKLELEGRVLRSSELVGELAEWIEDFPLVSIEDPLAEDDWDGWRLATQEFGDRVQLLGDDLFVTNAQRLSEAVDSDIANAILIKPNQAGTLSAAARAISVAREAGYATVVSARSGDTEDSWLADLAIAWGAGQIKVGSTHRSERAAKWNRILGIEATRFTSFSGIEGLAAYRNSV